MATLNQLNKKAQQMYGEEYEFLEGGEKASVSKALGHVGGLAAAKKGRRTQTSTRQTSVAPASASGGICSFLRFGMNGVKQVPFPEGATLEQAYNQQKTASDGIKIDSEKEGFVDKQSGATVTWNDTVHDGQLLVATVGVTSN